MTSAMLADLGVPDHVRDKWVARRRLLRIFRGAYVVGAVVPPLAREVAALALCGPGAVLSHASAAWLLGLGSEPAEVHVTVAGRRPRSRAGIRVHRTGELAAPDVARRHGLDVTAPARTIADLAADLDEDGLDRLVQEACARRACTVPDLQAMRARAAGRPGAARLARVLDAGPADLRSGGERRLRRLIRAAGLPEPAFNLRIGAWTVDAAWADARLVVELDGGAAHASPWARDRDARKTAELQASGWTVLRVTGRQLARRPAWVVGRIAAALAVAGPGA